MTSVIYSCISSWCSPTSFPAIVFLSYLNEVQQFNMASCAVGTTFSDKLGKYACYKCFVLEVALCLSSLLCGEGSSTTWNPLWVTWNEHKVQVLTNMLWFLTPRKKISSLYLLLVFPPREVLLFVFYDKKICPLFRFHFILFSDFSLKTAPTLVMYSFSEHSWFIIMNCQQYLSVNR